MALSSLLSLIFPRRCPACAIAHDANVDLEAGALCAECSDRLHPIVPPFCNSCGEPFDGEINTDSFRCSNCAGRPFFFDFAIAAYRSDGPARQIIHRFKYRKEIQLARVATAMLAEALEDNRIASTGGDWNLVPVPLHWTRRYRRGFNQAEELCRYLSRTTGSPVRNVLRRIRNTGSQARLDRTARLNNLRGAIQLRRRSVGAVSGQSILLVDDVFTTGSTVDECARALREGGAQCVVVVTVARG